MIYILLFTILVVVELSYFRIADHFNIIDKPNLRSSHTQITLRGGGVIFYIGMLIYFTFEGFQFPWFITGLTLISVISFADDIKPRDFKIRLAFHFSAMALMFYQLGIYSLPWYYTLLAFILSTGILNAYNFMDGINGITGLYSFVVFVSLWYINIFIQHFVEIEMIYVLLLSLLVFNFFNFRRNAKCFAGDVGAISIAFVIIFLLGKLIITSGDFSYIILLAVYGVDSVFTIFHRLILKENIFQAHRKHLFQLLANELKIPHLVVSTIYGLIQTFIVIGFFYFKLNSWTYFVVVISLLSTIYFLFKSYYYRSK